jgi:hypothetical protein
MGIGHQLTTSFNCSRWMVVGRNCHRRTASLMYGSSWHHFLSLFHWAAHTPFPIESDRVAALGARVPRLDAALGVVRFCQNGPFSEAVPGGTEQPVLKTGVFWPGSKSDLAAAERSLSAGGRAVRCQPTPRPARHVGFGRRRANERPPRAVPFAGETTSAMDRAGGGWVVGKAGSRLTDRPSPFLRAGRRPVKLESNGTRCVPSQ